MKQKRKMPKHIVLPNGMWRFVKSGGSSKATKRARSKTMGRFSKYRRKYGRHIRRGGNIFMNGLIGSKIPGGMVGKVVAGAIWNKVISPMVPKIVPMQSGATESAVLFGLPGGAGAVGSDMVMPGNTTGGSDFNY